MLKKSLSIIFVVSIFLIFMVFYIKRDKLQTVCDVISPIKFKLSSTDFSLDSLDTFDNKFTPHNAILAKNLNITETEAFILGNLAQNYASNLMEGRKVLVKDNQDLVYSKFSYRSKFYYSGYCIQNLNPCYKDGFEKRLSEIKRANYVVLDIDTDEIYKPEDMSAHQSDNFILIRKSHLPNKKTIEQTVPIAWDNGNIKIYFSDMTTKLAPDRNCSSDICKEILSCINNAKTSIDMAIYGYSSTPVIEEAFKNALKRGVNIRLVYDLDSSGNNIYPDTNRLLSILNNSVSDRKSKEANNIMHNKFYIFDDKILITGSANLSHTDMSGFNSNCIAVINSPQIAQIYKREFEQMYKGKFHNEKIVQPKNKVIISGTECEVYFSPQDKSITNAILPLIKNAQNYIYIPTFVLTEKRVTEELINAKRRGVDVKIIIDALNASVKHSKHKELRLGGVEVKTENYAGKMHSKSMIIDDKYTLIGSMNFSNSGEKKNDENLIVIKNPQIAQFYKQFFLLQWSRIDNRWLKLNARAEGVESIGSCSDGIDNNYDGLVDLNDLSCKK